MPFKMERRAPYAVAVQLAVALTGIAALAAHLVRPPPPPYPCATPAQILYDNHIACLPSVEAMSRVLAAPAGRDFVRAAYVRDDASGAWVRAEAGAAPAIAPVPPGGAVVDRTARLVTKH